MARKGERRDSNAGGPQTMCEYRDGVTNEPLLVSMFRIPVLGR